MKYVRLLVGVLALLLVPWVALVAVLTAMLFGTATGAPQEAAISALALVLVVLPYVAVRGLEIFASWNKGAAG
mgnify:CR=1 FL=1